MECSGQSQWELVSVVDNKQRGLHLRPDRLRLQNVDIVDKVRSTVVYYVLGVKFGFSLPPDEILCSDLLHKH